MYLKLSGSGEVVLVEPYNFRAFKLVIERAPEPMAEVRTALAHYAELEDEQTAWVSIPALRRWPEVAGDEVWQQTFAVMIEKARPHGWIDDRRQAIKAHVEWLR